MSALVRDSGDGAAAHGGVKRQRERELADKRQEKRVEDVLAHTSHIVNAISGINTNYIRTLNDERARLAERADVLQTLHTSDQLSGSEATTQLVYHHLKSLRGAVSGKVKDRFTDLLRAQVDEGQTQVLDTLAAHIDAALQGSLTEAVTQLSAERQLTATLVEQLRTYAQTLLETTKAANQRAFKAELEAMRKDVLVAKLRAAHLFEQNRLLRHEHEVDALVRVVAQLAEKSRFVESARTEVLRAKRHVRWLEQYLDLNGIVAAAQPESLVAVSGTKEGAAVPHSPPPNPALRQSAPHYFALKMLEHKEITLTELVDSWQGQEVRIQEAEQRYAQLEQVVKQVQHDAIVVHQRYLEERQRREIADRRITDMVRERLYPSQDAGVLQEVQRLRWAYTEVVDDAAQLAVNLKVCRDELQEAQAEVARLTSQVHQLKRDAETDQVALTIQELRSQYAERIRSLEEVSMRTQLQLTLAQQVSREYSSVAMEATDALQQASRANAELSEVPSPVARKEDSWLNSGWSEEVQRVEAQAEKLVSLTSDIKNFALQHGELYEAQMAKLMEQWSRVRSEAAETAKSTTAVARTFSRGSASSSDTLVSSTAHTEEVNTTRDSVVRATKMALREALMLLVASLQSTDVERANLLDASLSDAQYVTELVREVVAITSERDRLRAQVQVCRDLLEKNHVTVVERALMHDVPVEDSLNVAEAAERITVLRDQLAAAKQLCDRSLNEVKQLTNEKEAVQIRLTELTRAHEVLHAHAVRLADKLRTSLEKESALTAETVSLQHQIAHLVERPTPTASSVEDVGEDAEEVTSSAASRTTPSKLSALFTMLSATVQKLDEEVRALHSSRDGTSDSATALHDSELSSDKTGDAALFESLSRSGMMSVIRVLKETLQKAGLLKTSLASATGAQAAALCTVATAAAAPEEGDASSGASIIPPPSFEVQLQARAYEVAEHESRLAQYTAERQQMRERLQRAEQTAGELETANQRLLTISKSVLEKQNVLKAENEQLRAQVRQLTAPPAPVLSATDTTRTWLPGEATHNPTAHDVPAEEEAPTTLKQPQPRTESTEGNSERADVAALVVEATETTVVIAAEEEGEAQADHDITQTPANADEGQTP